MKKICFFVPEDHCEKVKNAMFEAKAGRIGDYERCSWQVKGIGQFQARQGAKPFLGKVDKLEKLEEYKVEMVCSNENIAQVIEAMKKAHPYETVAYEVYTIEEY